MVDANKRKHAKDPPSQPGVPGDYSIHLCFGIFWMGGEGVSGVWETGMLSWLPSVILEHRALHAACWAHASRLRPEGHDVLAGSQGAWCANAFPNFTQAASANRGTLQYILFKGAPGKPYSNVFDGPPTPQLSIHSSSGGICSSCLLVNES